MAFLVGTDEAGYGPNLGPLVVTATVWEFPDSNHFSDLYGLLEPAISSSVANAPSVVLADSKSLYKPGGSLEQLERGVFALLKTIDKSASDWASVFDVFDDAVGQRFTSIPWFEEFHLSVPIDADPSEVESLADGVRAQFTQTDIRCLQIVSRVVIAEEFNELIEEHGNKATALSRITLGLVKSLVDAIGDEKIVIHCDKHGGRSKYAPLLQPLFPDHLIEVCGEGRLESRYRWGPANRRVEACFVAKGESCIASALASMICKYLRELAMRSFNDFWCSRIPGLRPTAGYPVDAKRFKSEIVSTQKELDISDKKLWRSR